MGSMGKLMQFPDKLEKIPKLNKRRCDELRAEFTKTLKRLQTAQTFETKQDETNNLQRIVQEYQLTILEEENRRSLAVNLKDESRLEACTKEPKIIA